MSETAPEPPADGGAPASGGFLSRRILGIPAIFWILIVVVVAYLYFRNRSGGGSGTSSGGGGTPTTGNITVNPIQPPNFTISTSQEGEGNPPAKGHPPRHRVHNPQPTPKPKPTKKKHQHMTPVHHGGESENDSGSG